MNISLEDLKSFGLYDSLPEKLKLLKSGEYYCFYYTPDYDNSKISIVKDFIAINLNVSLYRDIYNVARQANSGDVFLGYFTNKFETRDGIFYLLLNSFYDNEKVADFYAYASDKDSKNELRISNLASVDIIGRESFSNALAYFVHPDKINSVISIYDVLDDFLKKQHKTSLYGALIKKVVQMVVSESSVMPEENGELRYMTIGEQAVLSEEQKEKLKTAKGLLRSLVNPNDIYIQTGWYFSTDDGMWRTNISDIQASLDDSFIVKLNDKLSFYKPPYCPLTQEQIINNIGRPEYLFREGYNGKLSDVLKHDILYAHYPELADYGLIFAYNGRGIFYNSSGKYINIQGDKAEDNILSILLHETQHGVQGIEGFATGGNLNFANFVIALGGKGVRSIFASISNFQKFISLRINTESLYVELRDAISKIKTDNQRANALKSEILSGYMDSYESFRSNCDNVGFNLIYLITDTKVFNEGAIIDFLERYYGDEIYDMFEEIKGAIEQADRATQKLMSEGFSLEDAKIINFNSYQNLLGEMEARGTQYAMKIPVNLSNYFFLTEWEKSPTKSVAVIGGRFIMRDVSKIVGACEKSRDGKYILHFKKSNDAVPFIHELGHIVHDVLVERGFSEVLKNEYDKEIVADDYQEYFVNVFLGYIYKYYFDSSIGKDLVSNFSIKENKIIFDLLSDIFSPEPKGLTEVSSYLSELEKSV